MNNGLDEYNVKKWIAVELIALHKSRGDKIYFVTRRIFTGSETLSALLRREFALPADVPAVIFTNRQPKTEFFRRIAAQVSCGDSDGDIRDSIQAGARPIRVLRSPASVNHELTHKGGFGRRSPPLVRKRIDCPLQPPPQLAREKRRPPYFDSL